MEVFILQSFGTLAIVLYAILLYRIESNPKRPVACKEVALYLTSLYLFIIAIIRFLASLNILQQLDGRIINGIITIPFLVYIWIEMKEGRKE